MSKEIFSPPTLMKPAGYSHVAKVTGGALVYIAGQVSADASGNLVGEGNLEAQAEQVFKNLKAAVEAAGGTMADIIRFRRRRKVTMHTNDDLMELMNRFYWRVKAGFGWRDLVAFRRRPRPDAPRHAS